MKTYNLAMVIDDSDVCQLAHKMLIHQSENIIKDSIFLPSGNSALSYLKRNMSNEAKWPDIILLDIDMPGMNGIEFLEHFENLPTSLTNKTQVYWLTGVQLDTLKMLNTKKVKKKNYIQKPLSKESLKSLAM